MYSKSSGFFFKISLIKISGGLIALHNASSYGHLEIAALLIKYNTDVNSVDKWMYTPLHEAAQKGRTQLCALLVSIRGLFKKNILKLKFP